MTLKRLWCDESAMINSAEIILITTILGLGIIVGVVVLRNQVVQELSDVATAVGALDQGYEYQGRTITIGTRTYSVAGSDYDDELDPLDYDPGDPTAHLIDITSPGPTLSNDTPGED